MLQPHDRLIVDVLRRVRRRLVRQMLGAAAANATVVCFALLSGLAAARLTDGESSLWWIALAAIGLGLFESLTSSMQQVQAARACVEVFTRIRQDLVDVAHHDGEQLGTAGSEQSILSLGTIDSENLDVLVLLAGTLTGAVFGAFTAVAVAVSVDPGLGLLIVAATAVGVIVMSGFHRQLLRRSLAHNDATRAVTSLTATAFDGWDTVAGLGLETALLDVSQRRAESAAVAGIAAARINARVQATGRLVGTVMLAAVALFVSRGVGPQSWNVGDTVTAIALIGALVPILTQVATGIGQLLTARAGATRLAALIQPTGATPTEALSAHPGSVADAIVVDGVSILSSGASSAALLDRITFNVANGMFIAICGPTGSGKSLLLQTMRGAVRQTSGSIRVNGSDPYLLNAELRRTTIAHAEQHPFLYNEAIADNLSLAADDTSARTAALWIAAADRLPETIGERPVGLHGREISGGQRRRLVIARAMASPASVITLDEPTGSLDASTERTIAQRLTERHRSVTLIVATNSPEVLRRADEVIMIVAGKVVARGHHHDLLAADPTYRGLGVIASSITLIVIAPAVFALIAAGVAAMFIPVSIWYRRRTRLALMTFLARYDDMAQSLGETSAGAPIAWTFGRPDQAQRFLLPNLEEGAAFQHLTELAAKYTPLVAVQQGIAMAVAIAMTPLLIDDSQQLGVLAAFVVALPGLFGGLNELAHLIEHLTTGSTALSRLAPLGLQIPSSVQSVSGAPARGSDLRLDKVRQTFNSFTLGPITMTFRAGVTAIIGETGAGKSTLARLIAGLDTPTEGTITTRDGRPSRDLRLSGRIVMLPQQPQLFPGTIHDNLSLARPAATANELSAFIQAHGLGDWLQHLPHGLGSAADHTLSEGDRHIVSLVQTLLKDPDIVILDEPTVSLDPLSANRVERATTAAFAHRVVILITHSLDTARQANSIAVLDAGQLIDHGTHDELMHRCQRYRQLTGEG